MKTLTIKTFLKEFVVHLAIFFSLLMLFYFMKTYPGSFADIEWYQFVESIPTFIYGITFCVLFYHLFLKKILLHTTFIKASKTLVALVVGFLIVDILFMNYTYAKRGYQGVTWFDITAVFRLLIFGAYAIAYSFIRGFALLRLQKANAEREKAAASLRTLRSQIEPHFIFNSLNNVYALSLEEKADKTAGSIEELSSLFRYTLKESKAEKVPVADELEFIEKYIHLHTIRLQENEKIQLRSSITWDKKDAQIAPLLIINFIENAFKYGISLQQSSFVEINADVHDAKMHLMVKNSVHETGKGIQNGFGLDNTKKRLELLYAGKYSLKEKRQDNTHEVELDINLS